MKFAVIKTGGKQYQVSEGDVLEVEKLPKAGDDGKIIFDKVLLIEDGKATQIGVPYLDGAKVLAEFVADGRAKKISVVHYKAKVRFHKTSGHRQPFTKVKITSIQ